LYIENDMIFFVKNVGKRQKIDSKNYIGEFHPRRKLPENRGKTQKSAAKRREKIRRPNALRT